ncbi:uncharacterized protein EDB93DRAFT_440941 [Suillus bovinus]|uniref:uncharacterized protein n=1 Tax=Suillus bovinus TaxID=48563 RepID=UPI001B876460|nr:uncharacterized protein EDB93DRAFT_440941 [Suillus bovinus]KAG2159051.1 hypothetical protein EDB93DRAFT_440941 [Suillus bovinus]
MRNSMGLRVGLQKRTSLGFLVVIVGNSSLEKLQPPKQLFLVATYERSALSYISTRGYKILWVSLITNVRGVPWLYLRPRNDGAKRPTNQLGVQATKALHTSDELVEEHSIPILSTTSEAVGTNIYARVTSRQMSQRAILQTHSAVHHRHRYVLYDSVHR